MSAPPPRFHGEFVPWVTAQKVVFALMLALSKSEPVRRSRSGWGVVALCCYAAFESVQVLVTALFLHIGQHSAAWGPAVSWMYDLLLPVIALKHVSFGMLYVCPMCVGFIGVSATEPNCNVRYGCIAGVISVLVTASLWIAYIEYRGVNARAQAVSYTCGLIRILLRLTHLLAVPITAVLATPFTCLSSSTVDFMGITGACDEGGVILEIVISILLLLLWCPLVLLNASVRFTGDPISLSVVSSVTGRTPVRRLAARLALVMFPAILPKLVSVWALSGAITFALLAGRITWMLPYYARWLNYISVAENCMVVAACLGSFFVSAVGATQHDDPFAFSWIAVVAVVGTGCFFIPVLRYRQLSKIHKRIRVAMQEAIDKHHRTSQSGNNLRHAVSRQRHHITQLSTAITGARFMANRSALNSSQGEIEDEEDQAQELFETLQAFELELIVRLELELKENVATRRQRGGRFLGTSLFVPTTTAIEKCMWLFGEGIRTFQRDMEALSLTKVEFARFIRVFTSDFKLATAALDAADRETNNFDIHFLVQSNYHALSRLRIDQEQQGEEQTEDNMQMFRRIKRLQGSLRPDDKSSASRLGVIIDTMHSAEELAQRRYARLLKEFPNGKYLGDMVSSFCRDVLSDPELGNLYGTEKGDDASSAYSGGAGSRKSSVAGSAVSGFGVGGNIAASRRTIKPRTRTADVAAMGQHFNIGVICLVVLTAATIGLNIFFKDLVAVKVDSIFLTGRMAWAASSSSLHLRPMGISSSATLIANARDDAVLWKESAAASFADTMDVHKAGDRWMARDLVFTHTRPDGHTYTHLWSLWDASNVLIRDVSELADQANNASISGYRSDVQWRFTMDNIVPVFLPAVSQLGAALEDATELILDQYFIGGGIAFCVAIVILLVLGVAVFGRALSRIAQVNRGVNDVVIAMTALEVGKVLANTAKAVAKVRKMHGLVGELLVGEEHDFDDGGIDATFTYEEDQDAKRAREHSRFSSEREPRNVRFATPGEPKTKTTPSVRFQSPRVVRFQSPREPVRSEDNENMLASIADEKSGPMDEGSPLLLPNSVSSDEEGDVSSTARVSDSEDDSVGSPRKIPHLDGLEGLAAGRDDDDALCPVDEIPAGLMRPTTLMGSSSRVVGLGGKNPTLGQVVGASPGVCVLTDCIGTVLFVNNAFTKMLGYTAEEIVGRNVTVFQPPEIAHGHDKLMSRVVDGGTPRVVGIQGRQVLGIHKDGSSVPMLLVINRVDVGNTMFFVASMQDTRAHNQPDGDDDMEEGGDSGTHRQLIVRVLLALLFVAMFQFASFVLGSQQLQRAVGHAVEVSQASKLHMLVNEVAFSAREVVIGDGDLWSLSEAVSTTNAYLQDLENIRFGLRFGNSTLGLEGSAGRNNEQDGILYGSAAGAVVDDGLDTELKAFIRHTRAIIDMFDPANSTRTPVGANATALALSDDLAFVLEATRGLVDTELLSSTSEYMAEFDAVAVEASTSSIALGAATCTVVFLLYVLVLRALVRTMMGTAQRTENLLKILPEELVKGNKDLLLFFTRAGGPTLARS